MADETLDDSLKVAATNTGIDEGTIVSKKPRPQASHRQRFVINWYLLLRNNFNDALTYFPFQMLHLVNLLFYTSFC